jgi:hypothetical protein
MINLNDIKNYLRLDSDDSRNINTSSEDISTQCWY